ncbi:hypothetical protein BLOT_016381 [Blomia tropicalis]|nr:hypothetical protein BLOT_016381 [Blomia tropicalis]
MGIENDQGKSSMRLCRLVPVDQMMWNGVADPHITQQLFTIVVSCGFVPILFLIITNDDGHGNVDDGHRRYGHMVK